MNKYLVSVIILNYNGRSLLPDCLESLKKQTYTKLEIIVVDNNSTDDSVSFIRGNFPDAKILELDKNYGFAAGNNRGVSHAEGAYILLLNNDTIASPELIENLVKHIEVSNVKVCAPKLLMHPSKSIINGVGISMNVMGFAWDRGIGEEDAEQYDEDKFNIFGASGGCMIFKKEIVNEIGLFDERYWMYYEDVDFSWRLRLLSYKIETVPDAVVYHKFRMSTDKRKIEERLFHQEKNRICNLLKNYSFKNMVKYFALTLYYDTKKSAAALLKGSIYNKIEAFHRLKAYLWNMVHIPGTLKRRYKVQRSRKVSDVEILESLDTRVGSHPVLVPDYRVMDRDSFMKRKVSVTHIEMGSNDTGVLGSGWSEKMVIKEGKRKYFCRRCGKKGVFYLSSHRDFSNIKFYATSIVDSSITFDFFVNGNYLGEGNITPGRICPMEIPVTPDLVSENDELECKIVIDKGKHPIIKGKYDKRIFFLAINRVLLS